MRPDAILQQTSDYDTPAKTGHNPGQYGSLRARYPVFLLVLLLCFTPVFAEGEVEELPPATAQAIHAAGMHDLRGSYRVEACRRLGATPSECERALRHFAGEPPPVFPPPVHNLALSYRIVFVPGFYSECLDPYLRPFEDVMQDLQAQGFKTDYFNVAGRGTVSENAAQLAQQFYAAQEEQRSIIVFAYSKGLIDTLEMLLRYPDVADKVTAVVSVAGAAKGSPLADQVHTLYRNVANWVPLPGCTSGSGIEIDDLRQSVRQQWWNAHGAAITVPLFALVAAPRPEQISTLTWATYQQLALTDPHNDGYLLWQDQIPPGSSLLGFVNADHWTVAVPVEAQLPWLSFIFGDEAPRTVMIQSAITLVAQTLVSKEEVHDQR